MNQNYNNKNKKFILPILPALNREDFNVEELNTRYSAGEDNALLAKYASTDGIDVETTIRFALITGRVGQVLIDALGGPSKAAGYLEDIRYALHAAYQMGAESQGKDMTGITQFDPEGTCGCRPCQYMKEQRSTMDTVLETVDFENSLPN